MDSYSDEKRLQAITDICEALHGIRELVKQKIEKYHCHVVAESELKDLFSICKQVKDILKALNIVSPLFNELYGKLMGLILNKNAYEISCFFEKVMVDRLEEIIDELHKYLIQENSDKKIIKIKYLDFFPEFDLYEHWLYKLLTKRYQVILSDEPDYLFYSCFGNQSLKYNCIRIFISNEAVYPNLNLCDYAVTYSDFRITDRLLPNQDALENLKFVQIADTLEAAGKLLERKSEFCNFVYSNKEGDPCRKELFDAVCSYKPVVSGGRFLNNTGYQIGDLEEFQSRFKFSIACENSYYKGYTTEKIINAFNAGTIPIYWGNPDISELINSNAIINCHDFPDLKSVVEEIRRLDQDDEAYMRKLTEPILAKPGLRERYLKDREEFVYHILEQPYASAFRRNRGLRGQWYNDFMCYMLGYPNEWFSPEKGYFVKARTTVGEDGPLVSILIPTYNRREMVKEAINSALNQTYSNTEIIVVDNCSTDGTYEELVKCYDGFEKVRVFQNEKNIGPVNNWRACLEKAKGKYVKFLFSDDFIRDNALERLVEVMEEDPTVGFVYSSVFVFMQEDRNKGFMLHKLGEETGRYEKDIFYKKMFEKEENLPVSPGCALLRREDVYIMEQIPNNLMGGVIVLQTEQELICLYYWMYLINMRIFTILMIHFRFSVIMAAL